MPLEKLTATHLLVEENIVHSTFLDRDVIVDAYLPTEVNDPANISLLLVNDGQDLRRMPFSDILDTLISNDEISSLICIGIHCGPDRKMEYGVAATPDYMGRGAKAGAYNDFIFKELLPYLRTRYFLPNFREKSFAGFSLGGLSALDIVWNHPEEFTKCGVFSGSLWWRSASYKDDYDDDKHRIMHEQVKNGTYFPWLHFFFECGAGDESADRNKNGIIDVIDDTRDLISELKKIGYSRDNIKYLELPNGKHDVPTWAAAFPDFLKWGWGKKENTLKKKRLSKGI